MRPFLGILCALAFAVHAVPAWPDCAPYYLSKWGSQGNGNSQFQSPMDVASDGSNIYVADTGNNRIQKFSYNGSYQTQWGTAGAGNGQFNAPRSVATDGPYIYVVDTGNNRVQKFSSSGVYSTQWGSAGGGNGQFSTPFGIAVHASGYVYVVDRDNNRIQKFTTNGGYVTQWGGVGTGDGQFNSPWAVAVNGAGDRVYVADWGNNRVQVFTSTGGYVTKWSTGAGGAALLHPAGLDLDAVSIYVSDGNHQIQRFTTTGTYLSSWGSLGAGDGQFNGPVGVVGSAGIYVADANNHRIQRFGVVPASLGLSQGSGSSVYGETVVLTAGSSPVVSNYSAIFYCGATSIGSAGFEAIVGLAHLFPTNLPVGSDTLTAVYSGSGGCSGPTSPYVVHTVTRASTTTALGGGLNPSGIGQAVTFTATVSVDYPGSGAPGDSVQFSVDSAPLGAPVPLSAGTASQTLSIWSAGAHSVVATYRGDAHFAGSASSPLSQTVLQARTPPSYVRKWGTSGTGNGQFQTPDGVAVSGGGTVYVADQDDNRIQRFTGGGAYLGKWGGSGAGAGQFDAPVAVAVDDSGLVYVADRNNNRIQKFTPSGAYLAQWGGEGTGDGQFSSPCGVALGDSGDVYVADHGNQRIQRFTHDGAYLSQWGTAGSGDGQFAGPLGIAVDGDGDVYVADSGNDRVQKFSGTGAYLAQWGSSGSGNGQFGTPRGVGVNGGGCVYVSDAANQRIQEFAGTGAYLAQWGTAGTGDGQFDGPSGLAVDASGNVYVADSGNDRIEEFQVLQRITSILDVAGDQGRQVRIRFTANGADEPLAMLPVTGYEVYRRIGAEASAAAGSGGRAAPAASVRRGVASPNGIALEGWDYVLGAPAHADTSYSVVVPTLADSNDAGTHWSAFLVRATTATPSIYYDSAPDSGYSKDNLPPAVPAPFLAAYAGGATHLHWGCNAEPDLWYYRVYRGSSADFVPGPSSLIAARSDTGYVDPGPAGSYYKLSAVDVNGNEGGCALLTPGGTVDAPAGSPAVFALEGVQPNPTRGDRLRVAFALPGAAPARLELLDVSGRRVVAREVGALGAGRHVLDLATGRRPAPGLYLVRLTQGADVRVARVAVLK
jgi:DNA-binding beta-propeller fold protein YncE